MDATDVTDDIVDGRGTLVEDELLGHVAYGLRYVLEGGGGLRPDEGEVILIALGTAP